MIMPELPDVIHFKNHFDNTALNQTIEKTSVQNEKILKEISKQKLTSWLKKNKFKSSNRYGKYLFAELAKGGYLIFHFGMTGSLAYFKEEKEEPRHARVIFDFENGNHLAYICRRMLGELDLTEDMDSFIEDHELGIDALSDELDAKRFTELMKSRRSDLKTALMNQELIAGIGNVYSDEILFQTGLHPKKRTDELDDKQYKKLFQNMKRILKTSSKYIGQVHRLPKNYLLPNRDGEGNCPKCGGPIEKINVSGRNGQYCPNCQQ